MADTVGEQPRLTPESVAMLAASLGKPIAPERLADVTAVLTELFELEAVFADLDLAAVDPDVDDTRWSERER
jgi:hypothetical protein